jgi:hypothetical protein
MKKFLFLVLVISAIFMMSCDDDSTNTCVKDSSRCNSDSTKIEVCDANGKWVVESTCSEPEVCVSISVEVVCKAPEATCTEDDLRCSTDKKRIEICDANGEWQYKSDCTGLMLCVGTDNNLTCEEPSTCIENSTRCTDDKNLETCDSEGNWVSEECTTGTECVEDDGAAECETIDTNCSDDDTRCTDDKTGIITCSGDNMEVIETCLDGKICVGSGTDTRCEVPSEAPLMEEIESASIMMNACGLDEAISNLNEDIYMLVNIANIDKTSLLGRGLGILPLDDFQKTVEKIINCNENSNTCSELATCLNIEVTNDTCTPKDFVNSCEGNKTVTCNWQGKVLKTTCEADTTCTVDEDYGDVDCFKEEATGCDDESFASSCNGNIITTCEWGTEKTFDCGDQRTCEMINSKATCTPHTDLPDCNEDTYESGCEGQFVLTCDQGKVLKSDCEITAGSGYVCKENPTFLEAFFFAGCVYNQVATSCNTLPSCDGNTLKYCVNGTEETYSCTDGGYTACSIESIEVEDDMGETTNQDIGLCTF